LGCTIYKTGVLLCTIFLVLGCGRWVSALESLKKDSTSRVVGGPCEYKEYKGTARIISIRHKTMPKTHGGFSYEPYEVKFSFHPDERIEESFAQVEGREYTLMLNNSWYPGPKFLHKYGIEVGAYFDCGLNVITKGSCTPIIFDFPDINLSDYFENNL